MPGQDPSVTNAVVSARRLIDNVELILTDSPVSPVNSGGPLINNRGEVVGIVIAGLNELLRDQLEGVGFAIPINYVKDVLPSLRAGAPES